MASSIASSMGGPCGSVDSGRAKCRGPLCARRALLSAGPRQQARPLACPALPGRAAATTPGTTCLPRPKWSQVGERTVAATPQAVTCACAHPSMPPPPLPLHLCPPVPTSPPPRPHLAPTSPPPRSHLAPTSPHPAVYLFRIVSFTAELFLFLYAGFSMWSTTLWQGDIYTRVGAQRGGGGAAATGGRAHQGSRGAQHSWYAPILPLAHWHGPAADAGGLEALADGPSSPRLLPCAAGQRDADGRPAGGGAGGARVCGARPHPHPPHPAGQHVAPRGLQNHSPPVGRHLVGWQHARGR